MSRLTTMQIIDDRKPPQIPLRLKRRGLPLAIALLIAFGAATVTMAVSMLLTVLAALQVGIAMQNAVSLALLVGVFLSSVVVLFILYYGTAAERSAPTHSDRVW